MSNSNFNIATIPSCFVLVNSIGIDCHAIGRRTVRIFVPEWNPFQLPAQSIVGLYGLVRCCTKELYKVFRLYPKPCYQILKANRKSCFQRDFKFFHEVIFGPRGKLDLKRTLEINCLILNNSIT